MRDPPPPSACELDRRNSSSSSVVLSPLRACRSVGSTRRAAKTYPTSKPSSAWAAASEDGRGQVRLLRIAKPRDPKHNRCTERPHAHGDTRTRHFIRCLIPSSSAVTCRSCAGSLSSTASHCSPPPKSSRLALHILRERRMHLARESLALATRSARLLHRPQWRRKLKADMPHGLKAALWLVVCGSLRAGGRRVVAAAHMERDA